MTDANGATGTASLPLMVGNTTPEVRFESPADGDFFTPGKAVAYKLAVRDAEDGESAAKADEFGVRTLVSAQWSSGDGIGAAVDPGLARMKQSDCFNCHTVEQKLVGPPLLEIAAKYRGQVGAVDATVERVIKGSANIWGQIPMLPHPQHTADEVHMMVRWIFSLEKGKGGPSLIRGLAGEVAAPADDKLRAATLEAVYTDAGRAPATPLSGKATVRLRSRRVEAESGDEISGPQKLGSGDAGGKQFLGAIGDQHYAKFSALNLADSGTITCRVASGGVGGTIEVRADSKTGDLLASLDVKPTGGWEKWTELSAPLKAPAARADIYVVFTNPGTGNLMNLDWIEFKAR